MTLLPRDLPHLMHVLHLLHWVTSNAGLTLFGGLQPHPSGMKYVFQRQLHAPKFLSPSSCCLALMYPFKTDHSSSLGLTTSPGFKGGWCSCISSRAHSLQISTLAACPKKDKASFLWGSGISSCKSSHSLAVSFSVTNLTATSFCQYSSIICC